jgi:long-subunit acyl-CoA synthetase (AMP-forming)
MQRTTIIDLLNDSVKKFSDNPFLWEKTKDKFEPTTYKETKQQAHILAAGLISLGVQKGDKVALLSEGRNAWIIGELGILLTGAINIPLSVKLEESNDLIFRLLHSEAKYIMVSGGQLKKIQAIIDDLPLVKTVIVLDEQAKYQEKEISYKSLLKQGKEYLKKNPKVVEERAATILPDDLANISYTSGTTADPKGIMLTHRNYTANVEQALTLMSIPTTYRTLIILPLDHCFAHVAGFYSFMASGASVGTVQVGKTGMETLKNIPINIKELKPNLLLSVPALAKSFRKNIESNIRAKEDQTCKGKRKFPVPFGTVTVHIHLRFPQQKLIVCDVICHVFGTFHRMVDRHFNFSIGLIKKCTVYIILIVRFFRIRQKQSIPVLSGKREIPAVQHFLYLHLTPFLHDQFDGIYRTRQFFDILTDMPVLQQ